MRCSLCHNEIEGAVRWETEKGYMHFGECPGMPEITSKKEAEAITRELLNMSFKPLGMACINCDSREKEIL